ncbi:carbohydrate ABC transporter permease [Microbacterium azadirachtae]|uniref:carbohydrate ABC transporter permease n=1 Tax=Microbacterium azadirachtae TaxID=582680 RepID=UPI00088451E4|nr:sugar ABC transporter permease [Microbacterium azadirachtae]SDM17149.1 carbohydrate ABC transporter membrane protein 1, CUT1 family [Microbacterium azadirachtae]SEG40185.1 carbohydrate ABC transporter membrane protein 1, CUT1 family [Microbacterium azadirachtae]SEG43275.1 carbohydrate ABC transporter membrane protein 1, CUT1 family [Microbacterium azadirachtae]
MTSALVREHARPTPRAPGAARPRRRGSVQRRRRASVAVMLAPTLLGLAIFFVYPLVANLYFSFTRYDLVSTPQWNGLNNYVYLFTKDPRIVTAALNTLWFVVILVPVRIVCALAVAGLLLRARRGGGIWRTIFYLPALVPPVASVVAFVFLFNPGTGPVNLVLRTLGIPGPLWFNDPALAKPSLVLLGVWVMGDVMIILLAALLNVPRDQYEAASLDGANGAQKVRYVTLPSIAPVLLFALVTGMIAALQYFTEAAVASGVASGRSGPTAGGIAADIGYPDDALLTYAQWLYVRGFANFQLGYAAAMAVVLFLVASVFVALLLRRSRAFSPEDFS